MGGKRIAAAAQRGKAQSGKPQPKDFTEGN
jgi:hypothetical protein